MVSGLGLPETPCIVVDLLGFGRPVGKETWQASRHALIARRSFLDDSLFVWLSAYRYTIRSEGGDKAWFNNVYVNNFSEENPGYSPSDPRPLPMQEQPKRKMHVVQASPKRYAPVPQVDHSFTISTVLRFIVSCLRPPPLRPSPIVALTRPINIHFFAFLLPTQLFVS